MGYMVVVGETLWRPRAWLSVFLFFTYMGIEFTLGTRAYTLLTEARGGPVRLAGLRMGSYWQIFTAGRIPAGASMRGASVSGNRRGGGHRLRPCRHSGPVPLARK